MVRRGLRGDEVGGYADGASIPPRAEPPVDTRRVEDVAARQAAGGGSLGELLEADDAGMVSLCSSLVSPYRADIRKDERKGL